MDIYHTKKWERIRRAVLARDKFLCQASLAEGRRVPANTVHHVIPVEDRPDLKWQTDLMISLSAEAHNRMHQRYSHELSEEGIELSLTVASRLSKKRLKQLKLNPPPIV